MATNRPSRLKGTVIAGGCVIVLVVALLSLPPLWSNDALDDAVALPLVIAWVVEAKPLPGSDAVFADADAVAAASAILLSTSPTVDPDIVTSDPRVKQETDGEAETILRSGDYPAGMLIITLQRDTASGNENAFLVNVTSGPLGRTVYRIVFSGKDDQITTQVDVLGMS